MKGRVHMNWTAILITGIICLTICYMCSSDDEK